MINNKFYLETLLRICRIPELNEKIERTELQSKVFRNKHFDYNPVFIPINSSTIDELTEKLLLYIKIINKVILLYKDNKDIRDFFNFSDKIQELILVSIAKEHNCFFSRFDGYISSSTNELKILENNSDSPAGTIFTPRINSMTLDFFKEYVDKDIFSKISSKSFLNDNVMIEKMISVFKNKYVREPKNIFILQFSNSANKESLEIEKMSSIFTNLHIQVIDPDELVFKNEDVFYKSIKIDIIWNKINTVFWNQAFDDNAFCDDWINLINAENEFINFNPFSYRYISENKLFASLLHDSAFSSIFSNQEREIINFFIPKTYKIDPKKKNDELNINEVRSNQNKYVLKQPYDIRGDGVTIGLDSDYNYWNEKIDSILLNGGIIQQYIKPKQLICLSSTQTKTMDVLNFHIDTFIFGNEILGFGGKASSNYKVNIFQGGIKMPVLVLKNSLE